MNSGFLICYLPRSADFGEHICSQQDFKLKLAIITYEQKMKWANQRWQLTTLYSSMLYLTWQRSCGSPHALRWSAWQCCSRLSCEAWSHPLLYCSALCTCTLPTPCLAGTCSPLCRSHRPALSPHPGPPSVARCCSLQSPEHNIPWRSA